MKLLEGINILLKSMLSFILGLSLMVGGESLSINAAKKVASNTTTTNKCTWIWNTNNALQNSATHLDFLKLKKVNCVYIQINQNISITSYQSFISKAQLQGIKVYALDGGSKWVHSHNYSLQNWLIQYQNSSTNNQKFIGIHLDIEPYLVSEWDTDRATVVKSYQDIIGRYAQFSKQNNLLMEADIPFWFDTITYENEYGKGNLAEWVIKTTDGITIMAYRDLAKGDNGIIGISQNEVKYANAYNKKIIIGVETMQISDTPFVSFYEEGEKIMNNELSIVKYSFQEYSSFNGISIHYIDSWKTMKK